MKIARDSGASRRPRADAARNREQLLKAAKASFAEHGTNASLEQIARSAGVGIGTLYRHFPTRHELVEAVYSHEIEQLAAAASRLGETQPPVEALRAWLLMFIDYMATKRVMTEALEAIGGGATDLHVRSGTLLKQSIAELVGRAVESGEIRVDIDPLDLLRALAGVITVGAGPHWRHSATRLVDILIAGVLVRPGES